jgi:geranylgeranyl diphosphate synthase, type II
VGGRTAATRRAVPHAPTRGAARANGRDAAFALDRALVVRLAAFERYFARVLPPRGTVPSRLHEAMRYGALAPGKRVRPLLALTACEAVGGRWRDALPAAAALECVHAFSLVHDDLPAMDDDDYRRGRLTTHKKYGEAMGLLAGDALIALAFEELVQLGRHGVTSARVSEAVRVLGRAAGSRELIAGQVLDLAAEQRGARRRPSAASVRAIHERKTGALIGAALELGALAGGARAATRRRFARLGRTMGWAFQIHDDLLNRGSSLARLGKRAGTDEARGKATWPAAVGEQAAARDCARLFAGVRRTVAAMGPEGRPLGALVEAIARRER